MKLPLHSTYATEWPLPVEQPILPPLPTFLSPHRVNLARLLRFRRDDGDHRQRTITEDCKNSSIQTGVVRLSFSLWERKRCDPIGARKP